MTQQQMTDASTFVCENCGEVTPFDSGELVYTRYMEHAVCEVCFEKLGRFRDDLDILPYTDTEVKP